MYLNKINLALLKTKYLNKLSFSVGGAFGFSPLDLFKNGEQGVWYDPSDISTLFQDAAGTTPVTSDGDPVGLMLDKSGNGNHATQSVSASRPTYRTDGTLHWLEFDGVDDYLSAGDVLDILDENIIMCAGYYGSRAVIAGKSVAEGESGRYFMPFNNDNTFTHLSSSFRVMYAFPVNSPLTTTMQVLRGTTNTLSLRKNGSVVSSKAMTPDMTSYNTGRPFWIGAYPSTTETIYGTTMNGNLYGLVTVRKFGDLGAENLDSLEGYISDKSGVTL